MTKKHGPFISEIFPNPKGKDSNQEWIELFNPTAQSISLSQWKLDDEEGGSRPYVFPENTTLNPHSHLLINSSKSKLNLNNTSDLVRLLTPKNQTVSLIHYKSPPENHSLSRISLPEENHQWIWTSSPTPQALNPSLIMLEGKIVKPPHNYQFTLSTNHQTKVISFKESQLPHSLASLLFTPHTKIKTFVQKETNPHILHSYQIHHHSPSPPPHKASPLFLFVILTIVILLFWIIQKKKHCKKKTKQQ